MPFAWPPLEPVRGDTFQVRHGTDLVRTSYIPVRAYNDLVRGDAFQVRHGTDLVRARCIPVRAYNDSSRFGDNALFGRNEPSPELVCRKRTHRTPKKLMSSLRSLCS